MWGSDMDDRGENEVLGVMRGKKGIEGVIGVTL